MYSKLQYISQGNISAEHLINIQKILDAGCTWIQLRMKNFDSNEVEDTAIKVRILCNKYNATFIVNDNPEIAKKTDADGVHLGLSDMTISEAKNILGNSKIIGGTANTIEHVVKRINEKCDYIGLGPFKFTSTKNNLSPILGLEGYKNIISKLNADQKSIPIYAIGGIELEDCKTILKTGIHGIAISGMLTNAANKKLIIEQIKNISHVDA